MKGITNQEQWQVVEDVLNQEIQPPNNIPKHPHINRITDIFII